MKISIFLFAYLIISGIAFVGKAQINEINYFNHSFADTNGFSDNISSINQQDQISINNINQTQQIVNQSTYIKQIGTKLKTMLRQENGGNIAMINSFGQNITQIVVQSGSGNTINSSMVNLTSTPTEARLYQEGINNNIVLWVNQVWNCERTELYPITISQEGNNSKISAFIDPFMPIIVRQTNGFAGGMEVEIRTSKGQTANSPK